MDICTKIMAMQLYPSYRQILRYIYTQIFRYICTQIFRYIDRYLENRQISRYKDRYFVNTSEIQMYERYLYICIQMDRKENRKIDRNVDNCIQLYRQICK